MKLMLYLLHFLCVLANVCTAHDSPVVETKYGRIKGFSYARSDGGESEVFLGIPFAQPPIGELRFEKPVPPKPWSDTLQADKYGPACPPHNNSVPVKPFDEDCLTLGITRPKHARAGDKLPVLIWIHGGGYSIGSASLYPYKGLANIYNPHGIITVQIQYRLGFLGFFADGESLPGNLGLWDQVEAIKFVREVIGQFGGDPDKITIWGLSAGGASVSQIALSHHTKDLFRGMIAMSGGALMGWASSDRVLRHSNELAREVGCTDAAALKACLRDTPLDAFYRAVDKLGSTQRSIDLLKWHPRVDGDFFLEEPETLLKMAPKRPQIMGVSLKESLFFVILQWTKSIHRIDVDKALFHTYNYTNFEADVKFFVANDEYFPGAKKEVLARVLDQYQEQRTNSLEAYAKVMSDLMFNVGAAREAEQRVAAAHPTFLYLTEHFNRALYAEDAPVKGATHVCEYPYVLDMFTLGSFDLTAPGELNVTRFFRESFVSFVKTGKPTNQVIDWQPSTERLDFVRVLSSPQRAKGFFAPETAFWNEIAADFGFDIASFSTKYSARRRTDEL